MKHRPKEHRGHAVSSTKQKVTLAGVPVGELEVAPGRKRKTNRNPETSCAACGGKRDGSDYITDASGRAPVCSACKARFDGASVVVTDSVVATLVKRVREWASKLDPKTRARIEKQLSRGFGSGNVMNLAMFVEREASKSGAVAKKATAAEERAKTREAVLKARKVGGAADARSALLSKIMDDLAVIADRQHARGNPARKPKMAKAKPKKAPKSRAKAKLKKRAASKAELRKQKPQKPHGRKNPRAKRPVDPRIEGRRTNLRNYLARVATSDHSMSLIKNALRDSRDNVKDALRILRKQAKDGAAKGSFVDELGPRARAAYKRAAKNAIKILTGSFKENPRRAKKRGAAKKGRATKRGRGRRRNAEAMKACAYCGKMTPVSKLDDEQTGDLICPRCLREATGDDWNHDGETCDCRTCSRQRRERKNPNRRCSMCSGHGFVKTTGYGRVGGRLVKKTGHARCSACKGSGVRPKKRGNPSPVLATLNPSRVAKTYGDLPAALKKRYRKAALMAARFDGIPLNEVPVTVVKTTHRSKHGLVSVGEHAATQYKKAKGSKRSGYLWHHAAGDHGRGSKKTKPAIVAVDADTKQQILVARRGSRPGFSSDRGLTG